MLKQELPKNSIDDSPEEVHEKDRGQENKQNGLQQPTYDRLSVARYQDRNRSMKAKTVQYWKGEGSVTEYQCPMAGRFTNRAQQHPRTRTNHHGSGQYPNKSVKDE